MCRENSRVAILTEGLYPYQIGGIQKHSYFLAKGLAQKQIIVDVYYGYDGTETEIDLSDHFTASELQYLNFKRIRFPEIFRFPGHYIYSSFLFSKKIYAEAEKEDHDLIYAQGFTSWYFLRRNPFQKDIISNLHGLNMFQKAVNFKNRLQLAGLQIPAKAIIQRSNKTISLGGKLSALLISQGLRKESLLEIPNGIDKSWILANDNINLRRVSQKLRFIFIGRYERLKGIEEFQEVISDSITELGYEVLFIGPIPEERTISHPNIHYLGSIKDSEIIKSYLISSDILVCPSYSEGMPTVILEAMACGCAIIATDVGAVSTMVDEKNGWLIRGDIKKGLRTAISAALELDQKQLLDKKKNSIYRVAKNFTWDRITEKTLKEFSFIISN